MANILFEIVLVAAFRCKTVHTLCTCSKRVAKSINKKKQDHYAKNQFRCFVRWKTHIGCVRTVLCVLCDVLTRNTLKNCRFDYELVAHLHSTLPTFLMRCKSTATTYSKMGKFIQEFYFFSSFTLNLKNDLIFNIAIAFCNTFMHINDGFVFPGKTIFIRISSQQFSEISMLENTQLAQLALAQQLNSLNKPFALIRFTQKNIMNSNKRILLQFRENL